MDDYVRVASTSPLLSQLLRVSVPTSVHGLGRVIGKGALRRSGGENALRDVSVAGGSKYPIELLKDAGVDMTTDEPLELTIQKMNRVMDEMDKLMAQQKP